METKDYYTLADIEKIVGVSHKTLASEVRRGNLRAVKLCGKWRVTAEELARYLQGARDGDNR